MLLLVALTALAYVPSLSGGFLIDDDILLTGSPLISASDGLWRFWFTTEAVDYWPVSNSSLWVEWRLWGMRATGYRVTNLILHIAESLLLWKIFSRLAIPGAALAALLFALHPVNVETVAWISQRKTLLAFLFVELSTLCYLNSELAPPNTAPKSINWSYPLSVAFFVLAMLSKVSVAVFPLLLLLVIAWSRPLRLGDARRLAPIFVLAGAIVLLNVWYRAGDPHILQPDSLVESIPRAAGAVWLYLSKALWPSGLVFMYPLPRGTWLSMEAAVGTSVMLVWYRRFGSRSLLFAWVFYLVALLPALGLTERPYVEDHYQHLGLVAVVAVVAAGWATLRARASSVLKRCLDFVAVAVVGSLALLTWQHTALYTDNTRLMKAAVETYPQSAVARRNLGFVLLESGNARKAILHFEEAVRLDPGLVEAHRSLGVALGAAGDLERGIDHLRQAVSLQPNDPEALANLGALLREAHESAAAIPILERAVRVYPDAVRTRCNLGKALLEVGEVARAIDQFEEASRRDPTSAEARRLLAVARDAGRASR